LKDYCTTRDLIIPGFLRKQDDKVIRIREERGREQEEN
jgi:hypothetical protein